MIKSLIVAAQLLVLVAGPTSFAQQRTSTPSTKTQTTSPNPIGRWQVKFSIGGLQKNLIADVKANGVAAFELLDTTADNGPVRQPEPAVWSILSNDRLSISGEAELPLGTCCRERGTLLLKGSFSSPNAITGKLLFVTSVDDEESPIKLRSEIGTFTATRLSKSSL